MTKAWDGRMSVPLRDPAGPAGEAADQAIAAAGLAQREAKKTAAAKQEIDKRFPSDHDQMVRALASEEQAALLRMGPRRNRWRDLLAFEEELVEIEQRRAALLEDVTALHSQLQDEPARHTAALATWMSAGQKGDRPASRIPELERAIKDRQDEHGACGVQYDRALHRRADHVARNRSRFERDVRKLKAKAADEYRGAIDRAEAHRQELLDLRATEVWVGAFPSDVLRTQPHTVTLAGARKAVQEPLLPGVKIGLEARNVFEFLRADVRFCADVATVDQYAKLEGVSAEKLTGREATWQNSQTDFIGPDFPATWRGSPEEAVQAERMKRYQEFLRKRLWGEGP